MDKSCFLLYNTYITYRRYRMYPKGGFYGKYLL